MGKPKIGTGHGENIKNSLVEVDPDKDGYEQRFEALKEAGQTG